MEPTAIPTSTALSTEFASLSQVIEANKGVAERGAKVIDDKLAAVANINLLELPVEQGDAIDADFAALQATITSSIQVNNERRSPITKRMDEIRSLFTSFENLLKTKGEGVKSWRVKWQAEKQRRINEAQQLIEQQLAKKNAGVDYQTAVSLAIENYYLAQTRHNLQTMNERFYSYDIPGLQQFETILRTYKPVLQPFEYQVADNPLLTREEMDGFKAKVQAEMYPVLNGHFVEEIQKEQHRLLELIPSRIAELQRIADNPDEAVEAQKRIIQEAVERERELNEAEQNRRDAAAATADADKLNNMFETTAAQPAVQLSQGTTVKRKYSPKSHRALIAIIKWWIEKQMGLLTLEELLKKFSFMITAANKELNKTGGVQIEAEGLLIEEDITVRGKR